MRSRMRMKPKGIFWGLLISLILWVVIAIAAFVIVDFVIGLF